MSRNASAKVVWPSKLPTVLLSIKESLISPSMLDFCKLDSVYFLETFLTDFGGVLDWEIEVLLFVLSGTWITFSGSLSLCVGLINHSHVSPTISPLI